MKDPHELRANLDVRWTHHSTAIEGNRLSHSDVAQVLLLGLTPGGHAHAIRDLDEVRGHAEAIATVRRWTDERRLPTPADLRGLHREVMFRPHWKAGPEGHRYWIEPGAYKQAPNHVVQRGGTIRRFADPEQVPELMVRCCGDFGARLEQLTAHPGARDVAAALAAAHQDFITIHPFDDGNGRMVRLIVNHLAMLLGFPPAIVELAERFEYYEAIQMADGGDPEPLRDLFARALGRALDFALAVADGRADPSWSNEHGDPELAPPGGPP